MCLAVPGRVVTIADRDPVMRMAKVSFGGIAKDISLVYVPEARPGDYVLVHAGFALQMVDEDEARKTLDMIREMREFAEPESPSKTAFQPSGG